MNVLLSMVASATATLSISALAQSAALTIPNNIDFDSGGCLYVTDGSVNASWMANIQGERKWLGFTIGQTSMAALDKAYPRSKSPYHGAGVYRDVLVKFHVGRSPFDVTAGLSKLTINPDRQSGSFDFNDGSAAGTWNCGRPITGSASGGESGDMDSKNREGAKSDQVVQPKRVKPGKLGECTYRSMTEAEPGTEARERFIKKCLKE